MNVIITNRFVLLTFIFVSLHLCSFTFSQNILPAEELSSAIFLIRQYGLNIPQNQSFCDPGTLFLCEVVDGSYHITRVQLNVPNPFVDVGLPDPNTVLNMSKLSTFNILNTRVAPSTIVANSSIHIMDYIKTLKSITSLTLQDTSIQYLPSDFSNFPKLSLVNLRLEPDSAIRVPLGFLNNSAVLYYNILTPVKFIYIDDTVYFPNLASFKFTSNCTASGSHILNFTSKSFPMIRSVEIELSPESDTTVYYNIWDPISTSNIKCGGSANIDATCNLFIGYPQKLDYLTLSGPLSTYSPSPITNVLYPILYSLELINVVITDFPISGSFPSSLYTIKVIGGLLDNIPVIPATVKVLYLDNNYDYCQSPRYLPFTTISTSLSPPNNFVCNVSIDQNPIVTNLGRANLTGQNLGHGDIQTTNYNLTGVIPNHSLLATFANPPTIGTEMTLQFATFSGAPTANVTVIEAGIKMGEISLRKQVGASSPRLVLSIELINYNPTMIHTVTLDNEPCLLFGTVLPNTYEWQPSKKLTAAHTYTVNMSNTYLSETKNFEIELPYPMIRVVTPIPANEGDAITLHGYFGTTPSTLTVTVLDQFSLLTQCPVVSATTSTIICNLINPINAPVEIIVSDDFFTKSYFVTAKYICDQTTSYCHGNGMCTDTGQCICKSTAWYDDCSKSYPVISSGYYDSEDTKLVHLIGDFGPNGQTKLFVMVNNSLTCTVDLAQQQSITCLLDQPPQYGLSSVQLHVDGFNTSVKNILFLRRPGGSDNSGGSGGSTTGSGGSETPQQQCQRLTSNCYNHGTCDNNGICQCKDTYNPDDNCFTKFINTTIKPNTTDPTVSFDIDGIDFQFEIVSIQELDLNNLIVKELFISNYTWSVNAETNNITTIVNYQLNTTNPNIIPIDVNSIIFRSVQVLSTISFSSVARDIEFGDQQLHINANSIKLAINITNWQYSSNVATLQVVFRTIVINNQSIEYDCKEKEIESLSYDSLSSLQYLRVVKDNIQFNGRFIDVALSDGRPTYSQTQLLSLTQSISNEQESIALIGINLPQCQECILDPDFSPLLIEKRNDGCESNDSKAWRIAVGVVVGVAGAVAIITTSIITFKKIQKKKKFQANVENKLKEFNS
ncbi:tenascin [Cavenderia fasciculata]|uniref:Tenascin n=1 Tax=Cavenderia fasciculata TaxID=261658 RepID=F4QB15_CACFS|nr:tenascin [Cavenderia fasciculata]EGG14787.1 tenascin [Cavenderia fasciculata]|eukprot:XP_004351303.1 tenascin [Cavenderia fasciculata]